jgi:hypothetical protein
VSNSHGNTSNDRPWKSRRQFGFDPLQRSDFHRLNGPALPSPATAAIF